MALLGVRGIWQAFCCWIASWLQWPYPQDVHEHAGRLVDAIVKGAGDDRAAIALLEAHPYLASYCSDELEQRSPLYPAAAPLICLAAERGMTRLMDELLRRGARAAERDGPHMLCQGQTPLLFAAQAHRLEAVGLLLRHGACVDDAGGAFILAPRPDTTGCEF